MHKTMKILRYFLAFLAVGTTSLLLAACYGVPVNLKYIQARARDKAKDLPIEGLRLELIRSDGSVVQQTWTNAEGRSIVNLDTTLLKDPESAPLAIRTVDEDGAQNGGPYAEKKVAIDASTEAVDLAME
jgi:hypothetical protein